MWVHMVLTLILESFVSRPLPCARTYQMYSPSEPQSGSDTDVPFVLVGDDAFALRSWMKNPHSKREMTAADRIWILIADDILIIFRNTLIS